MTISVIKADLQKNISVLIDILNENREYISGERRYKWLYLDNPAGKALIWLARDDSTNKNIGATAALPRLMWINGKKETCHVLSDFSMNKDYRTLGPAIKLNKQSLSPVFDGDIPFAYDFPSKQMAVVHKWLKAEPLSSFNRYYLPLKLSPLISEYALHKAVSGIVDKGCEIFINFFQQIKTDKKYFFSFNRIDRKSFDSSFDALDNAVGPLFAVCGSRNSSYLNWRYGENPLSSFFLIRVLYEEKLCGYAVLTITDNNRFNIYDIYSLKLDSVMDALLYAVIHSALSEKMNGIEITLPQNSVWIPFIKKRWFSLRESLLKVFVFIKQPVYYDMLSSSENWFLTIGDRDT